MDLGCGGGAKTGERPEGPEIRDLKASPSHPLEDVEECYRHFDLPVTPLRSPHHSSQLVTKYKIDEVNSSQKID